MIVQVVSCPQPPLLLPGVTGGLVPEVEKLRSACHEAIAGLATVDTIIVVGGAPDTREYPPDAPLPTGRFAPGLTPAPSDALPASLGVATALIDGVLDRGVELHGIGFATPAEECRQYGRRLAERPGIVGLLVMADGSARRGPKATPSPTSARRPSRCSRRAWSSR